jgi:hypothetical protein
VIGNFASDVEEIWIFLEEDDFLEQGGIEGEILDAGNPDLKPGTLYLEYREGFENVRPSIGREQREGRVDDLEIVLGDQVTGKLDNVEIYHDSVGAFQ